MEGLFSEHMGARMLHCVMGRQASYIPISLCFPPCHPWTLTAYFPSRLLFLLPPLVTLSKHASQITPSHVHGAHSVQQFLRCMLAVGHVTNPQAAE